MRVLIISNYRLIGASLVVSMQHLPLDEPVDVRLSPATAAGEVVRTWKPQVVLIEATIDFADAIATLSTFTTDATDVPVILVGKDADDASVYEAILGGASGYLTAGESLETLVSTVRGVAEGELGLSRRAANRVVRQLRQAARARSSSPQAEVKTNLTPREQEVFDLVRRGMRSREIAQHLTISEGTVYKHIQNVLEKLRVHSRTQAILLSGTANFETEDQQADTRPH